MYIIKNLVRKWTQNYVKDEEGGYPQLFLGGIVPYYPSSTRVLRVTQVGSGLNLKTTCDRASRREWGNAWFSLRRPHSSWQQDNKEARSTG